MAERMIGLSIARLFDGDHNHPDIPRFIAEFAGVLHTEGRKPAALVHLGVDNDFPLRLLLGIPKKDLTREQRLLAEGYCGLIFDRAVGDIDALWTLKPGWRPINPARVAAPLVESTLDVEWMLSLGITRRVWENVVLISDSALDSNNIRATQNRPPALMRYLLLLSIFGFSDPYQFFTASISVKTPRRIKE